VDQSACTLIKFLIVGYAIFFVFVRYLIWFTVGGVINQFFKLYVCINEVQKVQDR